LDNSRAEKGGIEEGGYIKKRRREKREERRRLNYAIYIDFLV
jgi:hypothetical protein